MKYKGITTMSKFVSTPLSLLFVVALIQQVAGFTTPVSTSRRRSRLSNAFLPPTQLLMAPKYDKSTQTWSPSNPEVEGPSAGYGIIGSLYRAGPLPFFQRIVNADTYEQAVLKYMATEGVDRIEAQGNMDAFLENPQDWGYQKLCEKNKGVAKKDYANANMDPQQIILSTLWAGVVVAFFYDLVTGVAEGRYGPDPNKSTDLLHGNLWNFNFF